MIAQKPPLPSVFISVSIAAVIWIVFGQTLHYDFVNYDDNVYVYQNPIVRSGLTFSGFAWAFTHIDAGNWHPLTTISHMIDCQLYGLNPEGHHFTNVVLHTVAAILLFAVLQQMTGTLWRSGVAAVLFAVHPLRAESVAWISERKDVLSGLFFMLTLGAYARYIAVRSLSRYLTTLMFMLLGLMSKSMLVTLPFVLLLLDHWPLKRAVDLRTFWKCTIEKIPMLVLAAAFSLTDNRRTACNDGHNGPIPASAAC